MNQIVNTKNCVRRLTYLVSLKLCISCVPWADVYVCWFAVDRLSVCNVCRGIVSSVFTQSGEGFYLMSPSEMARFSVSAHVVTRPCCVIRRHATQESLRGLYANPRRSTPQQTTRNHHRQNDVSPR